MVPVLATVATVGIAGFGRLYSKAGRRWINRMFYQGRHHAKLPRAERGWQGEAAPRVVYTNLDSQRLPYPSLDMMWN